MSLSVQLPRVLVVEDEAIVARDIAMQLSELGYVAVGIASSAEQALEMVAALAPDLVLMDIQLGGPTDGIAAAETIRQQYALPVVFITAYSADEILARAKLTEPYGYILKPFTDRELRVTLTMALYKHQAEAKLLNSSRQLKALSRHVLEVQELERRRVARACDRVNDLLGLAFGNDEAVVGHALEFFQDHLGFAHGVRGADDVDIGFPRRQAHAESVSDQPQVLVSRSEHQLAVLVAR